MKKGFTLIEMIVTMTIFVIIVFISVPAINGMLKQGNDDKYNLFLNDVFLATEAYMQKYSDDYPLDNGEKVFVYMSELVEENFLKSNIVNPNYCDYSGCYSKQISTCNENVCVVDKYTIIVGKKNDGVLHYLLVNKIINNVCYDDDTSCEKDNSTVIIKQNDDGSFELAEDE